MADNSKDPREVLLKRVKNYVNLAKFVRLNYLKNNLKETFIYLKECLRKAKEEEDLAIAEDEINIRKNLPLRLLNELGKNLDPIMTPQLMNLLKVIDEQGYVTPQQVMRELQVNKNRVRESLRPLLDRKILQVVILPRPEFKNAYGRGYGWFGDTIVHDFLLQRVYQLLDRLQIGVEVEYAFPYIDKLGNTCKKVSDGKIVVNGDIYILEVYTNVDTKEQKLIGELQIYGWHAKNSSKIKGILIMTETKQSKYELLRLIRKYAKEFRHYYCVFQYSRKGIEELSNFFLKENKYYGQRNKT